MLRRILVVLVGLCCGIGVFVMWPEERAQMLVTGATAAPSTAVEGAYDIFFTLKNPGPPDLLDSVATQAEGDIALVRPESYDATPIPAQSNVAFSSDGVFLRFQPGDGALSEGVLIPITLEFGDAGAVRMKATLQTPQDGQLDHSMHAAMDHGSMDHAAMPAMPQVGIRDIQVAPSEDDGAWIVSLSTEGFEFVEPEPGIDAPDTDGQGHAHLYLNGLKLGRMYAPTARINALPAGRYTVEITLNRNTHTPYMAHGKPVTAQALVEVNQGL